MLAGVVKPPPKESDTHTTQINQDVQNALEAIVDSETPADEPTVDEPTVPAETTKLTTLVEVELDNGQDANEAIAALQKRFKAAKLANENADLGRINSEEDLATVDDPKNSSLTPEALSSAIMDKITAEYVAILDELSKMEDGAEKLAADLYVEDRKGADSNILSILDQTDQTEDTAEGAKVPKATIESIIQDAAKEAGVLIELGADKAEVNTHTGNIENAKAALDALYAPGTNASDLRKAMLALEKALGDFNDFSAKFMFGTKNGKLVNTVKENLFISQNKEKVPQQSGIISQALDLLLNLKSANKKALAARNKLLEKYAKDTEHMGNEEFVKNIVSDTYELFAKYPDATLNGKSSFLESKLSLRDIAKRISGLNASSVDVDAKLAELYEELSLRGITTPAGLATKNSSTGKSFSLFSKIPNIFSLLTKTPIGASIVAAFKPAAQEEASFNTVMKELGEFIDKSHEIHANIWGVETERGGLKTDSLSRSNGEHAPERLGNNPAVWLMDSLGLFPENIHAMVGLEIFDWVATQAAESLYNDEEAIRKIYALSEYDNLSMALADATKHSGMPKNTVLKNLAARIRQHLAIQESPLVDGLMLDKMAVSLAQQGLVAAEKQGLVEFHSVARQLMNGDPKDSKKINFVRIRTETRNGVDRVDAAVDTFRKAHKLASPLITQMLGITSNFKYPETGAPGVKDIPKFIKGKHTKIPRKLREAIGKLQKVKHIANPQVKSGLERLGRDGILKHLTKFNSNVEGEHIFERDNIQSQNDYYERMADFMLEGLDNDKYPNGMFFKYFVASNHRIMQDTNTISPQNDLMHRFAFVAAEWETKVKITKTDSPEMVEFKLAVAQGMGINVANMTPAAALKQLEVKLADPKVVAALDLLMSDETKLFEGFEKTIIGDAVDFLGEGMHSFSVLTEYANYQKAKAKGSKNFTTNIGTEVDGTTNGFIAGLLQFPPSFNEATKNLLRSGGVGFKGDEPFHKYISDVSNLDNYQKLAQKMHHYLDVITSADEDTIQETFDLSDDEFTDYQANRGFLDIFRKLIPTLVENDEVTSAGRNWSKPPVMIIPYGAGIPASIRNMGDALILKLYQDISTASNTENYEAYTQIIEDFNRVTETDYEIMSEEQFLEGEALEELFDTEDHVAFVDSALSVIGPAIGTSVADIMGPMLEVRKPLYPAISFMNGVFAKLLGKRVAKRIRETGKNLTALEMEDLIVSMRDEGLLPGFAQSSSEGADDIMEITKFVDNLVKRTRKDAGEVITYFENKVVEFSDVWDADGNLDEESAAQKSISAQIYESIPTHETKVAVGASGIQGTDSNHMASIFGTGVPMFHVFDAAILGLDQVNDTTELMNKNFHNLHRDWSMGDAIFDNYNGWVDNFYSVLLSDTDRTEILSDVYAMQIAADKKATPESAFLEADNAFQAMIADVRKNRKALFEAIEYSDQFSKPGHAYHPHATERQVAASPENIMQEVELVKSDEADALLELMQEGDVEAADEALYAYFKNEDFSHNPIEVLKAYFTAEQYPEHQELIELIASSEVRVNVRIAPEAGFVNEDGRIEFSPRQNPLILISDAATSPAETLLHEMAHAATLSKITAAMRSNDPAVEADIAKLIKIAKNVARQRNKGKASLSRITGVLRSYAEGTTKMDETLLVSELIAYGVTDSAIKQLFTKATGTFKDFQNLATGFFGVGDYVANPNTAVEASREVEEQTAEDIFGSGPRLPNMTFSEKFMEKYKNNVTAETAAQLLSDLAKLNEVPLDPEHKAQLDSVMNTIIIPGLAGIDNLTQIIFNNQSTNENRGSIKDNTIYVELAGNRLSSNAHMSGEETLVHEYLHAVLKGAIEGSFAATQELKNLFDQAAQTITWQDLMPETVIGDPAIAEAAAKERYDYIFHNPAGNQLHEFAAIGLSNAPFAKALGKLQKNPPADKSVWSLNPLKTLKNIADAAFNWLFQKSTGTQKQSLHQALTTIAQGVVATNEKNMSFVSRMGEKVADTATGFDEKLRSKMEGTKLGTDVYTVAGLHEGSQELNDMYLEGVQEYLEPWQKTWIAFFGEVIPNNRFKKVWRDLLRRSKKEIDVAREQVAAYTSAKIREGFDPATPLKPSELQELHGLLSADVAALLDSGKKYSLADIASFLKNDAAIDSEITSLETKLLTQFGKTGVSYVNMTKLLGRFMNDGVTRKANTMLNAHNIANLYHLTPKVRKTLETQGFTNPKVAENMIDTLASLYAMKGLPAKTKETISRITEQELSRNVPVNGIDGILQLHRAHKKQSLQELFKGNKTSMVKGYTRDQYTNDVHIDYGPDTAQEKYRMRNLGYSYVKSLPKDPSDPNRQIMAMYSKEGTLSTYNKAIVSVTDKVAMGMNLIEARRKSDHPLFHSKGLADASTLRSKAYNAARATLDSRYDVDSESEVSAVPILSPTDGSIVGYRYIMTQENKVNILGQKGAVDESLGRMAASVVDKTASETINRDTVKAAKADWDKYKNDKRFGFIKVHADSKQANVAEFWRLMPSEMQQDMRDTFGEELMYIREDVFNLVAGFRKLSATKSLTKKFDLPPEMTKLLNFSEKMLMEVTQLFKMRLVVLDPAIFAGNVISNAMIHVVEGVPIPYIIKKGGEAMKAMNQYQKDQQAVFKLRQDIAIKSGKGLSVDREEALAAKMDKDILANPVHEMVDAGMFSSIVEELTPDETTLRGKMLSKAAGKLTDGFKEVFAPGGVPGTAKAIASNVMMLEGSEAFQLALKGTQYSDFVSRYIKFSYDTQVKKVPKDKAMYDALDAFIWYDEPQNAMMQYANDAGFFMFSKFLFRIQRVIGKMFLERPASTIASVGLQATIHDLDDISDQFLPMASFAGRSSILPISRIAEIEAMPLFSWMSWLL